MGFVIKINGEKAWESKDDDHTLVTAVTIRSAQGEAGVLNVPNSMQECDIIVTERDNLESEWLDVNTRRDEIERATRIEEASTDRVTEGRKLQEELDRKAAEEAGEEVPPDQSGSSGGNTPKASSKKEAVAL